MREIKKVTEQILRSLAKGVKFQFWSHFGPLWDPNPPQIKLFLYLPIEQSLQVLKKSVQRFLRYKC